MFSSQSSGARSSPYGRPAMGEGEHTFPVSHSPAADRRESGALLSGAYLDGQVSPPYGRPMLTTTADEQRPAAGSPRNGENEAGNYAFPLREAPTTSFESERRGGGPLLPGVHRAGQGPGQGQEPSPYGSQLSAPPYGGYQGYGSQGSAPYGRPGDADGAGRQLMAPSPVATESPYGYRDDEFAPDGSPEAPRRTESVFSDPIERIEQARERMRMMMRNTLRGYGRKVSRRPCCCVAWWLLVAVALVLIGVFHFPPEIDTDFNSFLVVDVESSIVLSAFEKAMEARESMNRRLDSSVYQSKVLYLIYELREDLELKGGILHDSVLKSILDYEAEMRAMPAWRELCHSADQSKVALCDPGISAARYMMPHRNITNTNTVVPQTLVLDGSGSEPLPTQPALLVLEQHDLVSLTMPKDQFSSAKYDNPVPSVLRSLFRFSIPCGSGSAAALAKCEQGKSRWKTFFADHLYPFLSENRTDAFKVWYSGSDVDTFEVSLALYGDFHYAIGSIVLVHLYVLLHTRSFLLCFAGPVISLLAVPVTYTLCAILFGSTQISFASFLALFLVVGFGADVVFVYTDFWQQSIKKERLASDTDRVLWTYGVAAKASFATTATTSLSFLANLASAIRALRQFALFMGLCVMVTWILISLAYLPLCVIDERFFSRFRVCHNQRLSVVGPWTRHLRRWRCCYVVIALIVCLGGAGIAATQFQLDSSVSIFPEGHNQNNGKRVADQFESPEDKLLRMTPKPETESICADSSASASGCAMAWCEAEERRNPGSCSAFAQFPLTCSRDAEMINVRARFVGTRPLSRQETTAALMELGQKSFTGVSTANSQISSDSLPRQLLNNWETGRFELHEQFNVNGQLTRAGSGDSCLWKVVVYCGGILQCKGSGTSGGLAITHDLTSPTSQRRLEVSTVPMPPRGGRLLASSKTIAKSRRARVRAVFGLSVPKEVSIFATSDPSDEWEFLADVPGSLFNLRDPWAQRNLNHFCKGVPLKPELEVSDQWCWMEDFRDWASTPIEHGSFPVRATSFTSVARQFIEAQTTSTRSGTRYLWMINGEIKAMYFSFEINVDKDEGDSALLLDLKSHWDKYMDDWNGYAKPQARKAFHVSKLWRTAEGPSTLMASTITSLGILLVLAFAGMLVFTWSIVLSLYTVVATMCVMCGLTFLITVVMRWSVGLIEIIAIIYFVGYAVTYSLHVAHKYSASNARKADPEDDAFAKRLTAISGNDRAPIRYLRTVYSLKAIGGAAMGSAMTTIGASFFLTFCTLTIFTKLGGMCLAVSVLSLIIALGPLPALLLSFGPVRPGACGSRDLYSEPWVRWGAAPPERKGTRE